MSAVFCQGEVQKKLAEQSRTQQEAKRGEKIRTPILPLAKFYLAEDYHQKYYLRLNKALFAEYRAIYPNLEDLYHSTAVARVNGYLGGHGSSGELLKEVESYGLSPEGREKLLKAVKKG